jgi:hypothetical protein
VQERCRSSTNHRAAPQFLLASAHFFCLSPDNALSAEGAHSVGGGFLGSRARQLGQCPCGRRLPKKARWARLYTAPGPPMPRVRATSCLLLCQTAAPACSTTNHLPPSLSVLPVQHQPTKTTYIHSCTPTRHQVIFCLLHSRAAELLVLVCLPLPVSPPRPCALTRSPQACHPARDTHRRWCR